MNRIDLWRLRALLHYKLYPIGMVRSSVYGGWFVPRGDWS